MQSPHLRSTRQIPNEAVGLNDHSDNKRKMRRKGLIKACQQLNQLAKYNSNHKQEVGVIMLLSNTM